LAVQYQLKVIEIQTTKNMTKKLQKMS